LTTITLVICATQSRGQSYHQHDILKTADPTTVSPGHPFILGWKGQRSRSRGTKNSASEGLSTLLKGKERYLRSTIYTMHSFKALRHGHGRTFGRDRSGLLGHW